MRRKGRCHLRAGASVGGCLGRDVFQPTLANPAALRSSNDLAGPGRLCYIQAMQRVFLALGSNLGDRRACIMRARDLIDAISRVRVVAMSSLHETAPEGYIDQPDFINAALEIETTLTPRKLLLELTRVERLMGRLPTVRFGPRIIDIDILLFGDIVVDDPDLVIPHPRMTERAFVLGPLSEIAPDAVHPVLNQTVKNIFAKYKKTSL